ncbi:MAG TPA: TIGR03364 family FAD-dependent oxidoreductase [Blastocatellia bacterium]
MSDRKADVAIVGAGILGLAHAYHAARRGRSVVVFERGLRVQGASVRNFGMIWPIGQPPGEMHQIALRSRELWVEVLKSAGLPYLPSGSLHLAYRSDEWAVLNEFQSIAPTLGYDCELLKPDAVLRLSNAVRPNGLLGGIWSPAELTVDPRVIVARLPEYLSNEFNVRFKFGTAVRYIDLPVIEAGTERWEFEKAIVCGGDDFETLYPDLFASSGIDRCKLQMLRTVPQPPGWQLGPALAAGLTLRFYASFSICGTLEALRKRIAAETPEYDRWVIHGLVSQTADGELTLGDSHEYGKAVDIFDKVEIDELMLRYLGTFLQVPNMRIAQRWHGVYSKHPDKSYVALTPAPEVRVVTAVGGSGMTLSFGLAERTINVMEI